MDRTEEAKELFTIAEEDLSSAQILMEKHWPTSDNVICNLCRQAGEKFIKKTLKPEFQPAKADGDCLTEEAIKVVEGKG